jgi:hypothetical protein
MYSLLGILFRIVFIYSDDMIIFSKPCSEHLLHHDQIFSILAENGLHINLMTKVFSLRKGWPLGYNEFDFFIENEIYRPCDECKIEI